MSLRAQIVTAADERYHPYLEGLISSIEKHRESDIPIGVLDLGLTAAQRQSFSPRVAGIVEPKWDYDFPLRSTSPGWFRAMTARPFLPEYFPDADLIIWLDSDSWLQDWRTIDLLIRGASDGRMAIVPELHRAYSYHYNRGNVRDNVFEAANQGWGEEVARRLSSVPVLNSGAFALKRDAKHWGVWANNLASAVQKTNHWLVEQTALNIAIYRDACPVHLLPAWCNWICQHATPVYDGERRCLCEQCLPYEKISLVHMTDHREREATVLTTDGAKIQSRLDFHSVQKLADVSRH